MDLSVFTNNLGKFSKAYSPDKLIGKITKVAKKAGLKTVYAALLLYNALLSQNIPLKDKAVVVAALGYFIMPVDIIADILPGGFVDDAGVLVYAAKLIWDNITPETHEKARAQLSKWFGEIDPADLTI